MSSLVIVAIPREDDLVWKISSEKVPHLTLMYLGEVEDANHAGRMAQFVQHALNINEHGPFYLEVDRRGELGEDKADVLFFENGWDTKWIKSLRGQLLKENNIRAAFEAQDQFPDWVPHLTLGYPDAPAKPVPDDRRIYSVEFDRVAVWVGDYEGPEFRLKWPERDDTNEAAIAYSDIGEATVEDLLHYGVKGMQWGKRKDRQGKDRQGKDRSSVIERPKNNLTRNQKIGVAAAVGGGALATAPVSWAAGGILGFGVANLHKGTRENLAKNRAQDKNYREDKKWEKEFKKDKKYVDVHNDAADHMNAFLPGYNKKYDGIDLTKNPTKMKEYEDGYFKENNVAFAKSYEKIYGKSPSGNYKVSVIPGTDKVVLHNVRADPSAFKHADETDEPLMTFRLTQDPATWHILKVEPVSDSLEQTAVRGAEFIEHYGVKGMKWGQRKENEAKKSGAAGMFDPEGHDKGTDIAKSVLWPLVPPLGVFAIPAQTRLTVGAARGAKAYLEHRKSPEQKAKRAEARLARRDFYWESHTYSEGLHADVHNKVADEIDHKVEQLASAPKYRGKNLKTDKALKDEYDQDVAKVTDAAYKRAVNDVYGVNPSGTKRGHFVDDARGQRVEIRDNNGKTLSERMLTSREELKRREEQAQLDSVLDHAANDERFDGPDIFITVKEDDNGFIVSMGRVKIPGDDDNMIHSMELGEEFVLEHFGIKGMRWGRRKAPPEAVSPTATSVVPHGTRRKTKVETEGGENHPAHEDAIKVAEAQAKLKRSGTKALSNRELQEVANRIQLEERVSLLTASSGRKFVRKHLTNQSDALARAGLQEGIKSGPTAAKKARRGATTLGRIAAMPV